MMGHESQAQSRRASHTDAIVRHVQFARRLPLQQQYIEAWRLVKRARFNAADRHERLERITTVAFALAGIFGFVVPYFLLVLQDDIPKQIGRVIEFTAYLSGALSLVLGLVERGSNHQERARRFHECGLEVNNLVRRLEATTLTTDDQLRPYLDAYDHALRNCGYNHAKIDEELASCPEDRLWLVNLKLAGKIYGSYVAVWVLPTLIMLVLLVVLPARAPG